MEPVKISIVIPAYNEEFRLPSTLQALVNDPYLNNQGYEVVLVVEPSRDQTLKVAKQWSDRYPALKIVENKQQKGKGYAVKTGMLQASGQFVFFMDADLSVPITSVASFVEEFEADKEVMVVFGSRRHPKSEIKVSQSLLRRKMGAIFNFAVQTISNLPWKDTQCGFKAFRLAAVKPLFGAQLLHGFSFDVEILILAKKFQYKVIEHPVVWSNSPQSHVKIVQDSLKMLRDIYQISRRHR
jgi:dolichyl-phosphate beta-glucosyltransferase